MAKLRNHRNSDIVRKKKLMVGKLRMDHDDWNWITLCMGPVEEKNYRIDDGRHIATPVVVGVSNASV
jgi:hypothetical protein